MTPCEAGAPYCRFLVIDDSEDIARLIRQYSDGEPIKSVIVSTAEAGLERFKETRFDVILMDYHLPGMNGASAVRSVRLLEKQLKRLPIPIFALTDLMDRGLGEQMLRAGCTALAGKPLSRQQFLTIASRWRRQEEHPIKPLRILIADDSADNRMLLQVYLTGTPHQLTFAGNGKVAVDRFAAESFDLILMDMQMPVTDGPTATRAIRAIEQERGIAATPIVALTASARPQDVALSVNAGCDQHLPKPISKQKFLYTIEEYGTLVDRLEVASPQKTETDIQAGLKEIIPGYLAARRKELPEMRALLAASSFAEIVAMAHNMKGTGYSYGFPPLTEMGAALERYAKQIDIAALSRQLTEINDYLDRVQDSVIH